MSSLLRDNEISILRFYDAPLSAVWEAWTDPAQAGQWWGPRGFTITTHGKDLRPGGIWSYTMHGPDGIDYPNKTVYLEVEHEARLVYDHGGNDDRPALFRVTAAFSARAGGTEMAMIMALPTRDEAEKIRGFIKSAGGDATWDRLGEFLEKQKTGKDVFIINRAFDAPAETVFEAWSNPGQLSEWLSPTGTSMKFLAANISAGGQSFYSMGNDSFTFYGRATYRAIERPHCMVYAQQFCDSEGRTTRHPMIPTWPETMLTHVAFTAIEKGKTLVTVQWEITGPATRQEIQTFVEGRPGMTVGWTGSFDKLEKFLATYPES